MSTKSANTDKKSTKLEQEIVNNLRNILRRLFPEAPPAKSFEVGFCALCGNFLPDEHYCLCRGLACCVAPFPSRPPVVTLICSPGAFVSREEVRMASYHCENAEKLHWKRWSVSHKDCGKEVASLVLPGPEWNRASGSSYDGRGSLGSLDGRGQV